MEIGGQEDILDSSVLCAAVFIYGRIMPLAVPSSFVPVCRINSHL